MAALESVLQLPFAYVWLPGLVFMLIVGAMYWIVRPAAQPAGSCGEPDTLLQQAQIALTPKNQRNTARRQGNPVEVYVAPPDGKNDPDVGCVLDRSMGGVRLALFEKVEIGALLSIRPVHDGEMIPWIDLEVRSCRVSVEIPGQFEVGCQYVKAPPYSIQLLLG